MSISSVKVADLLGIPVSDVENGLHELVMEGRLQTSKLDHPPTVKFIYYHQDQQFRNHFNKGKITKRRLSPDLLKS
jgi:hypothetical protein